MESVNDVVEAGGLGEVGDELVVLPRHACLRAVTVVATRDVPVDRDADDHDRGDAP